MMHLSVCEHLCDFGVGYICRFLPKDTNGCVQCELSCLVALVKPIDPLQNGAWFILEGDMV
jgi:hypothetical protein